MKNIFRTNLLIVFLLLWDVALFAQTGPGDEDTSGTLESEDTPAAPIDSHLIWLGILGTLYVLYFLYNRRNALTKE
jgi:hypothetical protein